MPIEPRHVLGLRGIDGQVSLGEEARFSGFLRDAALWVEDGSFSVPFSAAALELLAEYCCTAHRAFLQRAASEIDHMAQFTARIVDIDLDLFYEVLRAANFLDCDGLIEMATTATAKLLREVHKDPELLASVLGATQSEDTTAFLPRSSAWHASVNEPILEPPADMTITSAASHAIEDEDALFLCLLACDAPTLRALKGLSPAWRQRSRATLDDPHWQLMQHTLDLDWALGIEVRLPHAYANPCLQADLVNGLHAPPPPPQYSRLPRPYFRRLAASCTASDGRARSACARHYRGSRLSSYSSSPLTSGGSASGWACSVHARCARQPAMRTSVPSGQLIVTVRTAPRSVPSTCSPQASITSTAPRTMMSASA